MDYKDKLSPFNGPITTARHPTSLSQMCEGVIKTFIAYRASSAKVHVEKMGYPIEDIYQGLYNITRRKSIKPLVQVHKQDNEIILIKKGNKDE